MSYIGCIGSKVNSGLITGKQAKALQAEYEDLLQKYTGTIGDVKAATKAANDHVALKAKKLADKTESDEIAMLFQMTVKNSLSLRYAKSLKEFKDLPKHRRAMMRFTAGKPTFSDTVRDFLDSVGAAQQNAINQIYLPLHDAIKRSPKILSNDEFNATFKDAVLHAMGKNASTPLARQMGDAIRESFDLAHSMYTLAGGLMGKIKNYYPQVHNPQTLQRLYDEKGAAAAFTEWYNFLVPKLDRSKMIDDATGMPFTDKALREIMIDNFDTLRTDGLNKVDRLFEQGKVVGASGSDLNTRRDLARFYHFKDPDAWLEYNKRFGVSEDSLFDVTLAHLGTMGRDIGTMQKMGPKPKSVMQNLNLGMNRDSIQARYWTNSMYETISGALSAGGAEPAWYRAYNANRNILRSAMLGSAVIPALGDGWFIKIAARRFGIPGMSITSNLKAIREAGGIDSDSIKHFLTSSDHMLGSSSNRFGEDPSDLLARGLSRTEDVAARSSEFTHRASGLNWLTGQMETAAVMGAEHAVYAHRKIAFTKLPRAMQESLEMFGVDASQWDIVRKSQARTFGNHGAMYLGPMDVAKTGPGTKLDVMRASNNYGLWIRGFADAAINKPSARVRGIQTGGQQAGTVLRAAMSSATMFKGFSFSILLQHALPAMHRGIKHGEWSDLGMLMIPTLGIGAMAIQLREMAKGRDPRDMSDHRFWMAAALQAGALGPIGDVLFNEYGRFGRDPLVDMILGPVGGQVSDVGRLVMGNFNRALDDSEYEYLNKLVTDAYKMATYHIPGQSLWYARTLVKAVTDTPLKVLDPNYYDKREQTEAFRKENFGNDSFWKPGEFAPRRAPDLGAMLP